MLRNDEGSSYFSIFKKMKQLVLGTSPIVSIPTLSWAARLKEINYGNAFLKEEKEKNNNIAWAEKTTPCIPQLFCDPCDVNEQLIDSPVMFSDDYRNVLNVKYVEQLKKKNTDGILIYSHFVFVHLRFTSLEKLQTAKTKVEEELKTSREKLQADKTKTEKKIKEEMKNHPQLILLKERLDNINKSIENYESEKKIETYIHLFIEWYKCTYLEKNNFQKKSPLALMSELKKVITDLNLDEKKDFIQPLLYLEAEKKMQRLKQTSESIYPHQREKLCADIREIQTLQPNKTEMSKTTLTLLKYVHEVEMSDQIEKFVCAQEKIAALESSLSDDSKVPDKLVELTATETVKIFTADYYAQKERNLRELMDALETSYQILRGAIPLKNADFEEQTYFEIEREMKLFNDCIEKISALPFSNKPEPPQADIADSPRAAMLFTPGHQPSLADILQPSAKNSYIR